MQLSDNITDQVVYSVHVHVMLNYWNGYDDKDCDDEDIPIEEKIKLSSGVRLSVCLSVRSSSVSLFVEAVSVVYNNIAGVL